MFPHGTTHRHVMNAKTLPDLGHAIGARQVSQSHRLIAFSADGSERFNGWRESREAYRDELGQWHRVKT
jgi:hypothetical protein